ncbi:MAG: hypothetical protein A6F72_06740 [Cycloclasticus sp. symbiont of Poecilosclerida sp. N]|nr:MAG: hypothetical protein A6F72_06740 [Cycloclasticus sp. symbiont of Poecilosclerida sp. N]
MQSIEYKVIYRIYGHGRGWAVTANVHYPVTFSDKYLRPVVRLEIGPLASWLSYEAYSIKPYALEVFPYRPLDSLGLVTLTAHYRHI